MQWGWSHSVSVPYAACCSVPSGGSRQQSHECPATFLTFVSSFRVSCRDHATIICFQCVTWTLCRYLGPGGSGRNSC